MSHTNSELRLKAPLSGPVIPLAQVPDAVFAQKLVGDGLAIDPLDQVLLSPCDGTIAYLHPAGHAVTVSTLHGVQVLLHIGLDTVKLKGEGFSPQVKQGDLVKAGDPLIAFDADFIAQRAPSLITVMVVTEGPVEEITLTGKSLIAAGEEILKLKLGTAMSGLQTHQKQLIGNEVTFNWPEGLHARPAAQLVKLAKSFESKVEILKGSRSANAKSMVSLLSLEIEKDDKVKVAAGGTDAEKAIAELTAFMEHRAEAPSGRRPAPQPSAPNVFSGVAGAPGVAWGKTFKLADMVFEFSEKAPGSAKEESSRLQTAIEQATQELTDLEKSVGKHADSKQAAIFSAHRELLQDPEVFDIVDRLIAQGKSAAFAWDKAVKQQTQQLAALKNEMLANRAADMRDVGERVLRLLVQSPESSLPVFTAPTLLLAENITPSQMAQIPGSAVTGICTAEGGSTSHAAILARSLGIPALFGAGEKILNIADGTEAVLDAAQAQLRLNPPASEREKIEAENRAVAERRRQAMVHAFEPAVTKDGQTIEVAANIASVADARKAVEMGCDGVGLLRSEFLFQDRAYPPTEDEQRAVYQEITDILGQRPLTIRTLDVGGDKPLRYLPMPKEDNPFLGVRGLRLSFKHPEIFRLQLRAILKVRSATPLRVMFPMVTQLEELRTAKAMLEEERQALGAAKVQVGIMVEVPAVALMADDFAREVDFFSVGTNDLTQYTLAIDRGQRELAKLSAGLQGSVLKLIELSVQAAHRNNIWVGVCGGLAGDPAGIPALLKLGVEELSVAVPSLPLVKAQVRTLDLSQAAGGSEKHL